MKKIGISIISVLSLASMIGIVVIGVNSSTMNASEDTAEMTNGIDEEPKEESVNENNKKSNSESSFGHRNTYKPSEEEIANLSIPERISDSAKVDSTTSSDNKGPAYIVTETDQIKDTRAWHPTNDNDILVAEAVYKEGIEISELTNEVKSWFTDNQSVEEITVEGQIAIIHEDDNISELHIITTDKLFTVAGADRGTVIGIAEQIDYN